MIQIFQPLSKDLLQGNVWSNGQEQVEIIVVEEYFIGTEVIVTRRDGGHYTRTERVSDGKRVHFQLVTSRGSAFRETRTMKIGDFSRAYQPLGRRV
jgi:hypothetical protein